MPYKTREAHMLMQEGSTFKMIEPVLIENMSVYNHG